MNRMPTDAEWIGRRVRDLPRRWQLALFKRWKRRKDKDYYGANVALRVATKPYQLGPIPLDSSDSDICDLAESMSKHCVSRLSINQGLGQVKLRKDMEGVCRRLGVEPPPAKKKCQSAIARMTCVHWWRRQLRRSFGRAREAAAIRIGLVNRKGDLYVSDETAKARAQQNKRNASRLEATIARNELGTEYTLAELQAKSTANPKIRRQELMTRMRGFEEYADEMGHVGLFITVTCPGRFHRCKTVNNGKVVIDNPNYDPALTPDVGQQYLAKIWTHTRADLARKKIGYYGLRVAEPQHDGTPHWHMLLFCESRQATELERIITKHALKDSPNEPGAQEHRCKFEPIDKQKGSATGYIAKYIAKNIDGKHVGTDLEGMPAKDSVQRVAAWAAVWGIRQFQQLGGPTVTVWRELRRLAKLGADAPSFVLDAHAAANKRTSDEGQAVNASWGDYCKAQGGAFCGRDALIKLWKELPDQLGRYGDEPAPKPVGVQATKPASDGGTGAWFARSVRYVWEMLPSRVGATARAFFGEGAALGTLDLCQ